MNKIINEYFEENEWNYDTQEFTKYLLDRGYNVNLKCTGPIVKHYTGKSIVEIVTEYIYKDIFKHSNPSFRLKNIIKEIYKHSYILPGNILNNDPLLMTMYLDYYDLLTLSMHYNNLIDLIFYKMDKFYNKTTGLDMYKLINYASRHEVLKYFVPEVKKMISFYIRYNKDAIDYTGKIVTPKRLKELVVTYS